MRRTGRLGLQHQRHTVVFTINLRHRFDTRERETEAPKILGKGLGGFGDLIGVVGLARTNGDQRFELVFPTPRSARLRSH